MEQTRATPTDRPSGVGTTDGSGDRASPAAARAGWKAGAAAADGEPAPSANLSEAAWRKIDSALVEGDACRSENAVLNREMANLNEQVTTQASMLGLQSAAIDKLNQALVAKDQVLAQTQAEHKAELKVARGTLLGRAGRVVKYVALGVVVGMVIR